MNFRVFRLHKALLPCLLAAVFLALAITLHFTGAYAVYTGGTVRKLPIYSVEREDKKIAISFDCAWGVDYTQEILDVLAREDVRATFFMVEFWAEKYPEYVRKIALGGNEIGTHSSTHSYMSKLSGEEIRAELASSSAAIEKVTGKKVELFRAPYGDGAVPRALRRLRRPSHRNGAEHGAVHHTVGRGQPGLEGSLCGRHIHAHHQQRKERQHHSVPQQRLAHRRGAAHRAGYAQKQRL